MREIPNARATKKSSKLSDKLICTCYWCDVI